VWLECVNYLELGLMIKSGLRGRLPEYVPSPSTTPSARVPLAFGHDASTIGNFLRP
jgi:hypothetical protein